MPRASIRVGRAEKLIANVRATKALYDQTQKDYSDFALKTKLWNTVAAKSGIKNGQEAKMMWKKLRDAYRIYRNKMHVNPNSRMWKFYEQMDFLAAFIKHRKKRRPVLSSIPLATEGADVIARSIDVKENEGNFTTIQYWNETDATRPTEFQPRTTPVQGQTSEQPPAEFESDTDDQSYEDVIPEALVNGRVDKSLKMFFDAMYASTSQLPQGLQRSIKNKLFAAVLEAEEEVDRVRGSASMEL